MATMAALCLTTGIAVAENNPPENTPAGLFQQRCSGCHGEDGVGKTRAGKAFKAIDFHDPAVMKMSDAELTTIINNGKNRMPAFDHRLGPNDIQNLVAYIRTLQKK